MKPLSLLAALALAALLPSRLPAQAAPADSAWNSPRALQLLERARERRESTVADSGLVNYEADARVYVYFYLDRPGSGERNLVKTDQLALDVLWQAPDHVKQRIVGWRDEKSLPTNIHYHLDHLTVVQENFADEIRLGDGDEVRGVLHPAAPGGPDFYDYRLVDSLTLRLPGTPEPVRVYEMRVRPKDDRTAAFVGSIFVERRTGAIVRMDFTFTRAAYVDPSLDYINISLDNGLWEGRYWLPNEQRIEIRRHFPELELPVGSVIRGSMRVGNYRFNQPLPPTTFLGPRVVAVPRAQREAFPFEQGIHAEVREEGIGPAVELAQIRRMASELVRREALQRASGIRPTLGRASDVVRYDRAEGLAVGAGLGASPAPGVRAVLRGGYAFGAEHLFGSLGVSRSTAATVLSATAYANRPGDVGVGPVITGSMNTLTTLLAGRDYTDPYYRSGVSLGLTRRLGSAWSAGGEASLEWQRSARRTTDFSLSGSLRPVQRIDDADAVATASVSLSRDAPAEVARWWTADLRLRGGTLSPQVSCIPEARECDASTAFLKPTAALAWGRRWAPRDLSLSLAGRAGAAFGTLPAQELYLIGGRGTAPGYDFRRFGGDRFATASATAALDLLQPWLRGRVFGAVGWTGVGDPGRDALRRWGAVPSDGLLPSLGVGVGLVDDVLRVDLARGLRSFGRWELVVEANPSFWDFL
jgi:hypothetical protein